MALNGRRLSEQRPVLKAKVDNNGTGLRPQSLLIGPGSNRLLIGPARALAANDSRAPCRQRFPHLNEHIDALIAAFPCSYQLIIFRTMILMILMMIVIVLLVSFR